MTGFAAYFEFLAQHFPVMCASDEFHFMPRAETALEHLATLDCLRQTTLESHMTQVEAFRNEFEDQARRANSAEQAIDAHHVAANAAGVLIEMDQRRTWRYNPLLYLKIAFIGLEHALTKPAIDDAAIADRTVARLAAIPQLLQDGMANIAQVPQSYHPASLAMTRDAEQYLAEIRAPLAALRGKDVSSYLLSVKDALRRFTRFLQQVDVVPDTAVAQNSLTETLVQHFRSARTPEDIYTLAEEEWGTTLAALKQLGQRIDAQRPWQQIYHDYLPAKIERVDAYTLYGEEIERLEAFFKRHGFEANRSKAPLELTPTPTYLRSVRSSASFAAALHADPEEKSFFYLTPFWQDAPQSEESHQLALRLHREYPFLTAHETIPGHHYLDSVRRQLANPVRRQIESPLFYEGWATYVEVLLGEYGYIAHPLEHLVHLKRSLWRAARCMIDVGFTIGRLTPDGALDLLNTAGFDADTAVRQIDRFKLNPGYQLCYSLGRYELLRLRKKFGPHMSESALHRAILGGGELPFHAIEQQLAQRVAATQAS
jgi:uncharacterized protein (DUF885 family)